MQEYEKMTPEKIIKSMRELSPEIMLPEEIIGKASVSLRRMLEAS